MPIDKAISKLHYQAGRFFATEAAVVIEHVGLRHRQPVPHTREQENPDDDATLPESNETRDGRIGYFAAVVILILSGIALWVAYGH
jgi:hypothetical protein